MMIKTWNKLWYVLLKCEYSKLTSVRLLEEQLVSHRSFLKRLFLQFTVTTDSSPIHAS
jgi:hypothetical protein